MDSKQRFIIFAPILSAVLMTGVCFIGIKIVAEEKLQQVAAVSGPKLVQEDAAEIMPTIVFPQKLANPPEVINAVYVTAWSAQSSKYRQYLDSLFDKTEINAIVVDIKDYTGLVSYASEASEVKKFNLYNKMTLDLDDLVAWLHSKNIYVIGRIVVFEDSAFAKVHPELAVFDKKKTISPELNKRILWKDNNGLNWMDPSSKEVWDYNISLAKDVLKHGFDEINFDYIRFPSDGKTENMGFPMWDGKISKANAIADFFRYLRSELPNDKISADLFGQTTVNKDDVGIGQLLENSFEFFDYVAPMVYPSHYAAGFNGFSNPAAYPYEVVKYSMDSALEREVEYINKNLALSPHLEGQLSDVVKTAKFRPWLQDFNMGAVYNTKMVQEEMRAVKDALGNEYAGYMLWSPKNIYNIPSVVP